MHDRNNPRNSAGTRVWMKSAGGNTQKSRHKWSTESRLGWKNHTAAERLCACCSVSSMSNERNSDKGGMTESCQGERKKAAPSKKKKNSRREEKSVSQVIYQTVPKGISTLRIHGLKCLFKKLLYHILISFYFIWKMPEAKPTQERKKVIWAPADFVRLPTDNEMITVSFLRGVSPSREAQNTKTKAKKQKCSLKVQNDLFRVK